MYTSSAKRPVKQRTDEDEARNCWPLRGLDESRLCWLLMLAADSRSKAFKVARAAFCFFFFGPLPSSRMCRPSSFGACASVVAYRCVSPLANSRCVEQKSTKQLRYVSTQQEEGVGRVVASPGYTGKTNEADGPLSRDPEVQEKRDTERVSTSKLKKPLHAHLRPGRVVCKPVCTYIQILRFEGVLC